jgi:hypothetical protein
MNEANACATVFNTAASWYVANYYEGSLFGFANVPNSPNENKMINARAGQVNIFNVNNHIDRRNGDNFCILPSASTNTGKMIFVIYGGDLSNKSNGNSLVFATGGEQIDTAVATLNSSNNPYIVVNEGGADFKTTGAVFISDGTRWCVLGHVRTTYCTGWSPRDQTYLDKVRSVVPIATSQTNIYVSGTASITNPSIALPSYISGLPGENSLLSIIKYKNVAGELEIYANPQGQTANTFNQYSHYYTTACATRNYPCVWVVSEKTAQNAYKFYPVVLY